MLHLGDCRDILPTLDDNSVDAIVTDPPYELGFMGRDWDRSGIANDVTVWAECLRVLKPGGHLAAFGGTRTYHRMACAVEDAGFEIRDSLHWLYGSGFPKSLDVGKAIDKAAGAEREVVGEKLSPTGVPYSKLHGPSSGRSGGGIMGDPVAVSRLSEMATAPATPAAQQWDGWGTALKPSHEPVVLARKPLEGTVAGNVLAWGVGGLHVDACRTSLDGMQTHWEKYAPSGKIGFSGADGERTGGAYNAAGRWPANVLLSHDPACNGVCASGCAVGELDHQSGPLHTQDPRTRAPAAVPGPNTATRFGTGAVIAYDDPKGSGASRFFPVFRYQAKAPTSERPKIDGKGWPTVKPLALMEWLVKLITPPGGVVLDPFAGTGTTLHAAQRQGFTAIGIERDELAHALALQRLDGDVQDTLFGVSA
jgi:site-specific DNA-methyltransferase (adenine-specific)